MQIVIINVQVLALGRPIQDIFSRLCWRDLIQSKLATILYIDLYKLLNQVFGRYQRQSQIENRTQYKKTKPNTGDVDTLEASMALTLANKGAEVSKLFSEK